MMTSHSVQLFAPTTVQRGARRAQAKPLRVAVVAGATQSSRNIGSLLAAAGIVGILANPFIAARAADFIEVNNEKEARKAEILEATRAKAENRMPKEIRIKGSSDGPIVTQLKKATEEKKSIKPTGTEANMDKTGMTADRKASRAKALSDAREKALASSALNTVKK